jgi:hypothetical protein
MTMADGEDTPTEAPRPQNANLAPAWKPGQSGNPAGRPKGARGKLSEDFFKALAADFADNGAAAIEKMRIERPGDYAKMVAGLQTKEMTGEDGAPLFPSEVVWRRAEPRA